MVDEKELLRHYGPHVVHGHAEPVAVNASATNAIGKIGLLRNPCSRHVEEANAFLLPMRKSINADLGKELSGNHTNGPNIWSEHLMLSIYRKEPGTFYGGQFPELPVA
jgi:hypothetical protein